MNMRASRASELRQILHIVILKLLFPSIFLLVLQILCLRNIYIFRSPITSPYIYNQCSFLSLLIMLMVWHYNKRQYADKILTLRKSMYMYMRASFHIQKVLFLSIFCWYFRNFVGTNYILVGLHVPKISKYTDKTPKKHYWGGGGQSPMLPSGYASVGT